MHPCPVLKVTNVLAFTLLVPHFCSCGGGVETGKAPIVPTNFSSNNNSASDGLLPQGSPPPSTNTQPKPLEDASVDTGSAQQGAVDKGSSQPCNPKALLFSLARVDDGADEPTPTGPPPQILTTYSECENSYEDFDSGPKQQCQNCRVKANAVWLFVEKQCKCEVPYEGSPGTSTGSCAALDNIFTFRSQYYCLYKDTTKRSSCIACSQRPNTLWSVGLSNGTGVCKCAAGKTGDPNSTAGCQTPSTNPPPNNQQGGGTTTPPAACPTAQTGCACDVDQECPACSDCGKMFQGTWGETLDPANNLPRWKSQWILECKSSRQCAATTATPVPQPAATPSSDVSTAPVPTPEASSDPSAPCSK